MNRCTGNTRMLERNEIALLVKHLEPGDTHPFKVLKRSTEEILVSCDTEQRARLWWEHITQAQGLPNA